LEQRPRHQRRQWTSRRLQYVHCVLLRMDISVWVNLGSSSHDQARLSVPKYHGLTAPANLPGVIMTHRVQLAICVVIELGVSVPHQGESVEAMQCYLKLSMLRCFGLTNRRGADLAASLWISVTRTSPRRLFCPLTNQSAPVLSQRLDADFAVLLTLSYLSVYNPCAPSISHVQTRIHLYTSNFFPYTARPQRVLPSVNLALLPRHGVSREAICRVRRV
jgi:hypothetical protein